MHEKNLSLSTFRRKLKTYLSHYNEHHLVPLLHIFVTTFCYLLMAIEYCCYIDSINIAININEQYAVYKNMQRFIIKSFTESRKGPQLAFGSRKRQCFNSNVSSSYQLQCYNFYQKVNTRKIWHRICTIIKYNIVLQFMLKPEIRKYC